MEEKRREGTQRALFRAMVARMRSTTSPLRLSAVPHVFGQIWVQFFAFFLLLNTTCCIPKTCATHIFLRFLSAARNLF